MASLEKRGQSFRIVFCYQGVKYARSFSTRSDKAAASALARLDDNLHRLELGTLDPPDGDDLIGFLLGDGWPKQSVVPSDEASGKPRTPETLTLAALFADYWSNLPTGSLEQSTISGMEIHQRQLEKHFGKDFLIPSLTKGVKYRKDSEKPPFITFAEVDRRVRNASAAVAADLWECVFLSLNESLNCWNWSRDEHGSPLFIRCSCLPPTPA